jgi:hypothetical protein
MTDVYYTVDLEAVSQRLLDISRAQAHALESDDWVEFDRLCTARDDLQDLLDAAPTSDVPASVTEMLEEVLSVDGATARLIQGLTSETSDAVSRAHRAHTALIGYGRPSSEPHSPLLDTQR